MRKADNLPPYRAVVMKSVSLNFVELSGPARPVLGELYLLLVSVKSRFQGHSETGKYYVNANYTIGNRTCDIPGCSTVLNPTAPPRAPL